VHVGADDAVVQGLLVRNATFGILVEKAHRAVVRGNDVRGPDHGPLGMRGDGIRLWETRDSLVEGNHVTGGRDVVVWYSPGNRVVSNLVERGRYGTHFMYSSESVVEDNVYVGNVVGVFVMYSADVALRRNVLARGSGAAGMGLGVKESGNLTVEDNLVVRNTVGCYLDTSPLQQNHANVFARNSFRLCETAVLFHGSETRNTFEGNTFRDNQSQVRVDGGGDAMGVKWSGNDFDTYAGYDLDGDGFGDVPYVLASLSEEMQGRHPELAFFNGSPTLWMVDAVSHAFPLLTPSKVLVDPEPRVGAGPAEVAHAN
jgi:nitrous oxidase accessory protein